MPRIFKITALFMRSFFIALYKIILPVIATAPVALRRHFIYPKSIIKLAKNLIVTIPLNESREPFFTRFGFKVSVFVPTKWDDIEVFFCHIKRFLENESVPTRFSIRKETWTLRRLDEVIRIDLGSEFNGSFSDLTDSHLLCQAVQYFLVLREKKLESYFSDRIT